jgi:hypothetical protein
MNTNAIFFDSQRLFGSGLHSVIPQSWRRQVVERGFAGLNGLISIDLGRRGRKIKQTGRLAATSMTALKKMMDGISGYIDGQCYSLVDQNGIEYANVRMDSFDTSDPVVTANQVSCSYEISYTQL